jgi:hypothetical protein
LIELHTRWNIINLASIVDRRQSSSIIIVMGESTPLLPGAGGNGTSIAPSRTSSDAAGTSLSAVSTIFVVSQVGLLTFFVFGATYSEEDYDVKQYIAFRDIMAMVSDPAAASHLRRTLSLEKPRLL